jgi:hypothetical protein
MEAVLDEKTIARDVTRGGKFLRALGTRPRIRAMLTPRGYTEKEHQRLWALILVLMGYKPSPIQPSATNANLESLTYIDNNDGRLLNLLRHVLAARYADQHDYIAGGLVAQTGAASVAVVERVVDRYAALRDGTDPERGSTRALDRQVADLLATRGVLSPAIEAMYREHLANAKAIAPTLPEAPLLEGEKEYREAAMDFHISVNEWREIARDTITRRDYQIALGLAGRRKGGKGGGGKGGGEGGDDDGPMD